jgi:endonuclease I
MVMERRLFIFSLIWMIAGMASAQAPANTGYYYQKADGKKGAELKTALYEIIRTPSVVDYDSLWHAYQFSDARPMGDSLIIWDMYSDISRYRIDFPLHKNSVEGISGFQREHSMPKSWFNPKDRTSSGLTYKDVKPMYSDIVHVIPTDGTVNNKRSNNAYGEITDASKIDWQSANGFSKQSKKGGCGTPGWAEYMGADAKKARVFEPNDEYKGDLARIYFYMATCYEDTVGTWTSPMFDSLATDGYQPFAQWAFDMLMRWAKQDPVSKKEIDRNEACYQLQGNRNPFVDYPGLEDYIWGEKKEEPFRYGGEELKDDLTASNTIISLNEKTFGVDWTATKNMRNYYSRLPLTYSQDGVDVIFAYGIEGSRMYCDSTQIRLYNKNVLTFKAHQSEITSIEFTIPAKAEDKELIPLVGQMEGNTWRGQAQEVQFTSTYTSSWPEANANKHIQIADVKITVASPSGITQHTSPIIQEPSPIYDLQGRRVVQPVKGVYIKNIRKFIVK